MRFSHAPSSVFTFLLAAALSPVSAQEVGRTFDCVIQPRAVVKIGSPAEGILRDVDVRSGDVVEKDQVLARLDSSIEDAEVAVVRARAENTAEVEAARSQVEFETSRLARVTALLQRGVTTAEKFEEAQIQLRLAELSLRSAESTRHIAGLELRRAQTRAKMRIVRSPVEGVVVERMMSPGEYAYAQSPIMTIAEIDPLQVQVYAPIAVFDNIFVGDRAEVLPAEPVGGIYEAKVRVVDRVHDPASSTFGVLLLLDNPGYHLPAGLRCTVRFLPNQE